MGYLIASRITRIRARITKKEAQLDVLDDELEKATIAASFRLNDGEGSISTEYRSVHEIRNNIRILESEIEALYAKLNGTGIVNIQLRRRG